MRLRYEAPTARPAEPESVRQLLVEFRDVLEREGMASIDEYGDLLKWGLPKRDGMCRSLHAFHPDFCSYSDEFWGTVHYHGGHIQGTVLAGGLWHDTYQATPAPDGDRFLDGRPYRLTRRTTRHDEGAVYGLPAGVPHWIRPTALTLTYFEEEDNGEMGDLLNPADKVIDDQPWTQAQTDALLPDLLALIEERIEQPALVA